MSYEIARARDVLRRGGGAGWEEGGVQAQPCRSPARGGGVAAVRKTGEAAPHHAPPMPAAGGSHPQPRPPTLAGEGGDVFIAAPAPLRKGSMWPHPTATYGHTPHPAPPPQHGYDGHNGRGHVHHHQALRYDAPYLHGRDGGSVFQQQQPPYPTAVTSAVPPGRGHSVVRAGAVPLAHPRQASVDAGAGAAAPCVHPGDTSRGPLHAQHRPGRGAGGGRPPGSPGGGGGHPAPRAPVGVQGASPTPTHPRSTAGGHPHASLTHGATAVYRRSASPMARGPAAAASDASGVGRLPLTPSQWFVDPGLLNHRRPRGVNDTVVIAGAHQYLHDAVALAPGGEASDARPRSGGFTVAVGSRRVKVRVAHGLLDGSLGAAAPAPPASPRPVLGAMPAPADRPVASADTLTAVVYLFSRGRGYLGSGRVDRGHPPASESAGASTAAMTRGAVAFSPPAAVDDGDAAAAASEITVGPLRPQALHRAVLVVFATSGVACGVPAPSACGRIIHCEGATFTTAGAPVVNIVRGGARWVEVAYGAHPSAAGPRPLDTHAPRDLELPSGPVAALLTLVPLDAPRAPPRAGAAGSNPRPSQVDDNNNNNNDDGDAAASAITFSAAASPVVVGPPSFPALAPGRVYRLDVAVAGAAGGQSIANPGSSVEPGAAECSLYFATPPAFDATALDVRVQPTEGAVGRAAFRFPEVGRATATVPPALTPNALAVQVAYEVVLVNKTRGTGVRFTPQGAPITAHGDVACDVAAGDAYQLVCSARVAPPHHLQRATDFETWCAYDVVHPPVALPAVHCVGRLAQAGGVGGGGDLHWVSSAAACVVALADGTTREVDACADTNRGPNEQRGQRKFTLAMASLSAAVAAAAAQTDGGSRAAVENIIDDGDGGGGCGDGNFLAATASASAPPRDTVHAGPGEQESGGARLVVVEGDIAALPAGSSVRVPFAALAPPSAAFVASMISLCVLGDAVRVAVRPTRYVDTAPDARGRTTMVTATAHCQVGHRVIRSSANEADPPTTVDIPYARGVEGAVRCWVVVASRDPRLLSATVASAVRECHVLTAVGVEPDATALTLTWTSSAPRMRVSVGVVQRDVTIDHAAADGRAVPSRAVVDDLLPGTAYSIALDGDPSSCVNRVKGFALTCPPVPCIEATPNDTGTASFEFHTRHLAHVEFTAPRAGPRAAAAAGEIGVRPEWRLLVRVFADPNGGAADELTLRPGESGAVRLPDADVPVDCEVMYVVDSRDVTPVAGGGPAGGTAPIDLGWLNTTATSAPVRYRVPPVASLAHLSYNPARRTLSWASTAGRFEVRLQPCDASPRGRSSSKPVGDDDVMQTTTHAPFLEIGYADDDDDPDADATSDSHRDGHAPAPRGPAVREVGGDVARRLPSAWRRQPLEVFVSAANAAGVVLRGCVLPALRQPPLRKLLADVRCRVGGTLGAVLDGEGGAGRDPRRGSSDSTAVPPVTFSLLHSAWAATHVSDAVHTRADGSCAARGGFRVWAQAVLPPGAVGGGALAQRQAGKRAPSEPPPRAPLLPLNASVSPGVDVAVLVRAAVEDIQEGTAVLRLWWGTGGGVFAPPPCDLAVGVTYAHPATGDEHAHASSLIAVGPADDATGGTRVTLDRLPLLTFVRIAVRGRALAGSPVELVVLTPPPAPSVRILSLLPDEVRIAVAAVPGAPRPRRRGGGRQSAEAGAPAPTVPPHTTLEYVRDGDVVLHGASDAVAPPEEGAAFRVTYACSARVDLAAAAASPALAGLLNATAAGAACAVEVPRVAPLAVPRVDKVTPTTAVLSWAGCGAGATFDVHLQWCAGAAGTSTSPPLPQTAGGVWPPAYPAQQTPADDDDDDDDASLSGSDGDSAGNTGTPTRALVWGAPRSRKGETANVAAGPHRSLTTSAPQVFFTQLQPSSAYRVRVTSDACGSQVVEALLLTPPELAAPEVRLSTVTALPAVSGGPLVTAAITLPSFVAAPAVAAGRRGRKARPTAHARSRSRSASGTRGVSRGAKPHKGGKKGGRASLAGVDVVPATDVRVIQQTEAVFMVGGYIVARWVDTTGRVVEGDAAVEYRDSTLTMSGLWNDVVDGAVFARVPRAVVEGVLRTRVVAEGGPGATAPGGMDTLNNGVAAEARFEVPLVHTVYNVRAAIDEVTDTGFVLAWDTAAHAPVHGEFHAVAELASCAAATCTVDASPPAHTARQLFGDGSAVGDALMEPPQPTVGTALPRGRKGAAFAQLLPDALYVVRVLHPANPAVAAEDGAACPSPSVDILCATRPRPPAPAGLQVARVPGKVLLTGVDASKEDTRDAFPELDDPPPTLRSTYHTYTCIRVLPENIHYVSRAPRVHCCDEMMYHGTPPVVKLWRRDAEGRVVIDVDEGAVGATRTMLQYFNVTERAPPCVVEHLRSSVSEVPVEELNTVHSLRVVDLRPMAVDADPRRAATEATRYIARVAWEVMFDAYRYEVALSRRIDVHSPHGAAAANETVQTVTTTQPNALLEGLLPHTLYDVCVRCPTCECVPVRHAFLTPPTAPDRGVLRPTVRDLVVRFHLPRALPREGGVVTSYVVELAPLQAADAAAGKSTAHARRCNAEEKTTKNSKSGRVFISGSTDQRVEARLTSGAKYTLRYYTRAEVASADAAAGGALDAVRSEVTEVALSTAAVEPHSLRYIASCRVEGRRSITVGWSVDDDPADIVSHVQKCAIPAAKLAALPTSSLMALWEDDAVDQAQLLPFWELPLEFEEVQVEGRVEHTFCVASCEAYLFRVRCRPARPAPGQKWSGWSRTTPVRSGVKHPSVVELRAELVGAGSIDVSWSPVAAVGQPPPAQFEVAYRPADVRAWTAVTAAAPRATLVDLTPLTFYKIKVTPLGNPEGVSGSTPKLITVRTAHAMQIRPEVLEARTSSGHHTVYNP